jgi:hypothetical protein
VKKIYFIDPYFKTRDHESDFKGHQMFSDNLAKIKRRKMPALDGKIGSLPPIALSIKTGRKSLV